LAGTAFWMLKGRERHDDDYREREITRLRLALEAGPWVCDVDGPIVEHAGCSTVGVDQLWIEVAS
jgi:hypothetical protein